ncbi:arylformamidase [Exiguobacterium sp. Helios]|jgi:arylformamidase|uniref:arylformamidase n=1 Tax=unclassified Exiguobacterium TaxID=2644629 RepID=UPI00103ED904|nr:MULTISPECIES: arylformamidase [unclassified Exiguobacterium]QNR19838.1 arylformamidase [Exiguobacterium sp. Helios]
MNRWIDVSQPLTSSVTTWPGDTKFNYTINWSKADTGSVNVGQVTMSLHTGTHIDAPFHFDDAGQKVIDLDPDLYIGHVRVIYLPGRTELVASDLDAFDLTDVRRLIIKTDGWVDKSIFPETIPVLTPSLAERLGALGIELIGLDLPSVDAIDSKEMAAHHALAAHGVHILEGLVLDTITPGDYHLNAVPLPLVDGDGSPVRALMRPY